MVMLQNKVNKNEKKKVKEENYVRCEIIQVKIVKKFNYLK